ncbi:cytochrome P450 [Candidatus Nitrospira allomarina]|uniref:Cytochrome P450 n=1 Tax=Candidatus Nitrospira allomarina TaxID=3020900 RepID=A0AA96JVT0_9BACT|nr:cytochrome P450 [Candidatus Nitrospira allomarina]WNM57241.1 cytochrome P450 [Candidatus Nitrospira allomarina]
MTSLITVIAVLLPLAPILNVYRLPGFIRRLRLFPRVFVLLSSAIVLYISLTVLLVLYFPRYVPAVLVLAFPLVFYLYFWRARSTFGSKKRLPPGSLRLAPPGPWVDYLYYQKQADKHGPIFKMNNFVQPMICLAGIELGTEFLKLHEDDTTTPPMPFNSRIPGGFMRYMAPAIHMEYRNKMKNIFSDHIFLQGKEELIGEIIRDNLSKMSSHTKCTNPVPHFQNMAFSIFVALFLGISPHDQDFRRLQKLYEKIDYRHALFTTKSKIDQSLDEIEKIFLSHVHERPSYFRSFLGDQLHDCSTYSHDTTLLRNFIYLLQTSWIDVSDLLFWMFKLLSDNAQWIKALRTNLHSQDESLRQSAHQLGNRVVLETLRLEQSEYLMRKALRDIEFEGFLIPKGWLVRIGIRESHRDADIFPNPNAFNPDRFLTTSIGPKQYSPFGIQQKSCLGKGLTLWIGQKVVLELAQGFTWKVVHDGPRELGVFHWRPSAKLRVQMSSFSINSA